jgi:hypothetical protein
MKLALQRFLKQPDSPEIIQALNSPDVTEGLPELRSLHTAVTVKNNLKTMVSECSEPGKNRPVLGGVVGILTSGLSIDERVEEIGLEVSKAKSAGRTESKEIGTRVLKQPVSVRDVVRNVIDKAEREAIVAIVKSFGYVPSGSATDTYCFPMGLSALYHLYCSSIALVLKKYDELLGFPDPSKLNTLKRVHRDILAVRAGCKMYQEWTRLTQDQIKHDVSNFI